MGSRESCGRGGAGGVMRLCHVDNWLLLREGEMHGTGWEWIARF